MPALPPVPRVVFLRVSGVRGGMPWNNIYHLQYTGTAPTETDLGSVCNVTLGNYQADFQALFSTGTEITKCEAADLSAPTAAVGEASTATLGTRVGEELPNQVASVISWHINLRYRGGHPRSYLVAGVVSDIQAGRQWTDEFRGELSAAATSFLGDQNGITTGATTYKMVTVSYFTAHALRPAPLVMLINSATVDDRVDTVRRRLGKGLP